MLAAAGAVLGLWARQGPRWAALGLLCACATGSDDPVIPGPPVLSGSGSGSSPTISTGSGTDAVTSAASEDAGPGTQGTMGSLDSTGAGASSDGAPSTDGSTGAPPPPVCPPEAEDTPCISCGKLQCCPEYTACLADVDCVCALDCYLGGMPTEDCILMCGISVTAVGLFNCASMMCGDVCT